MRHVNFTGILKYKQITQSRPDDQTNAIVKKKKKKKNMKEPAE